MSCPYRNRAALKACACGFYQGLPAGSIFLPSWMQLYAELLHATCYTIHYLIRPVSCFYYILIKGGKQGFEVDHKKWYDGFLQIASFFSSDFSNTTCFQFQANFCCSDPPNYGICAIIGMALPYQL